MERHAPMTPAPTLAVIDKDALCENKHRNNVRLLVKEVAAAYRNSLMVGLPPPDGAFTTTSQAVAHLDSGGLIATMNDAGQLMGGAFLRRQAEGWLISRLAVARQFQGLGNAGRLLDLVARWAAGQRGERLILNAVVERFLPPVYTRYGFLAVDVCAAEDKLLTEVTMHRSLTPVERNGIGELPLWPSAQPPRPTTLWLEDAEGLSVCFFDEPVVMRDALSQVRSAWYARVTDRGRRRHGLKLIGADVWTGRRTPKNIWSVLHSQFSIPECTTPCFCRVAATHPLSMPRALHRDLWAAIRLPLGKGVTL